MDNIYFTIFAFVFAVISPVVESRHCTYISASGIPRTFFCSSYEYCCGNGCCRPAVITFYQLWYFWLSVIMILLLCSGGSWWYRFKYRNQFLSPSMRYISTGPNLVAPSRHQQQQQQTIGVFYYPGNDRVYIHKEAQMMPHQQMGGGLMTPPPYSMNPNPPPIGFVGANNYQGYPLPPPSPSSMMPQPPPPPPFVGPPPSYDSINTGGGALSYPLSPMANLGANNNNQNAGLQVRLPYDTTDSNNLRVRSFEQS